MERSVVDGRGQDWSGLEGSGLEWLFINQSKYKVV
jgi:hypothetical protein